MYDIIEVTINGQKVNPNDIEKYAWNVAQCEVGIAEAGEAW